MTGAEWIVELAAALHVDPPDEATTDSLLELAGTAAHASERIAAPLACWLVGKAGVAPEEALALARSLS